jgi:protein involved in polysaccharide export with SLBB domain
VVLARTLKLVCFLAFASVVVATAQDSQLIHHGDLIDIDIAGGLEFDWRGRMNPEGFLDGLEGVTEPIPALCRSEADVAVDVARAYSRILRDPQAIVRVIDKSSRPLALIDGAVANPMRLQLNRWPTLREAIVISGGLTAEASGEIIIFRPGNASCGGQSNGPETRTITVRSLLEGQKDSNPEIRHGDLVTVRRADIIYVLGGVPNPGQIASRETTTLSRVIAASGGLLKSADGSRVGLIRREEGVLKTTEHDLRKIEKKVAPDPVLKAGDVVEIPEKGSTQRRYERPEPEKERPILPLRIVD